VTQYCDMTLGLK